MNQQGVLQPAATSRPPAIVIAAGGAGTRIGGDKADRMLGGRRLIAHVLDWARAHSDCLAIATRDAATPGSDGCDLPLLPDAAAGLGPISALRSAIAFARQQGRAQVMLVGCDMPFLPADLVCRLQAEIGSLAAALPVRNERLHPLAGLWRADPLPLDQWIASDGRSLWRFAQSAGMIAVDWSAGDHDPFANINTPADLARAETRLAGEPRA